METALYRDQRGCKKCAGEHEPWNSVSGAPARSLFQDMHVFWSMERGYKSCLTGSEHSPCLCLIYQQHQQELVLAGSRWILCFAVQCGCTLPASTLLVPTVVKGCIPDSCLLVSSCTCVHWFDYIRMCRCSCSSVSCGRKFKRFPVPCVVNVCCIYFEWCNNFWVIPTSSFAVFSERQFCIHLAINMLISSLLIGKAQSSPFLLISSALLGDFSWPFCPFSCFFSTTFLDRETTTAPSITELGEQGIYTGKIIPDSLFSAFFSDGVQHYVVTHSCHSTSRWWFQKTVNDNPRIPSCNFCLQLKPDSTWVPKHDLKAFNLSVEKI